MNPSRLLILVLPLFLAACALSPQQKADYARVEDRGVSPAIYDKMVHGDPLSIHDIIALSHADVNSGIILRYLRDHDITYFISAADVKHMERAGVDQSVIDYILLNARGCWWSPGPYPFFGAEAYSSKHGFYSGYFSGFYFGGSGWGHHP